MTENVQSDKPEKKDRPGTVVVHASAIRVMCKPVVPSPDTKTKADERVR